MANAGAPSSDDRSPVNPPPTPVRRWGCAWATTVSDRIGALPPQEGGEVAAHTSTGRTGASTRP
eukprot:5696878-Alexandrium_andersonii.AAC.1